MSFDFDIQYKPGTENRVADALSRMPHETELSTMSVPLVLHWEVIKTEVDADDFLRKVKEGLQANGQAYPGFKLDSGQLTYKGRLIISKKSTSIPLLLQDYHCSPVGGHSRVLKTYQRLISDLFWVGMKQDVVDYVSRCAICQQNKNLNLSPAGLLQPIPLPELVWDEVTMDFIEGLPKLDGVDTIFVVVDRITKYAHFIPLRHPFMAPMVAAAFVKEIVRLHGIPKSIISNRDKIFLSLFWKELFRLQGTALKRSTTHHPQTDGQTEVVNRCLETYLHCFILDKPTKWAKWLAWAEYWYNTSYHTSLKTTPFRALYGRDPPPLLRMETGSSPVDAVEQLLGERDSMLDDLKMHLWRAQQKIKTAADGSRMDISSEVGDLVHVKLRPYRQQSLARRANEKLAPRYYGPFRVENKVGTVAYKLTLPPSTSIHPVFYISQLRPALGASLIGSAIPSQLTSELELVVQPAAVLGIRPHPAFGSREREVLIQ